MVETLLFWGCCCCCCFVTALLVLVTIVSVAVAVAVVVMQNCRNFHCSPNFKCKFACNKWGRAW